MNGPASKPEARDPRDGQGGDPPRARGPPAEQRHGVRPGESTPARAGTTRSAATSRGVKRDHPRTRGDHGETQRHAAAARGPPPHARGPRPDEVPALGGNGTTPARAGTTAPDTSPGPGLRDHPRTRGDHELFLRGTTRRRGPPPHARGPPGDAGDGAAGPGTTPARAGTTVRDLQLYVAEGLFLLTSRGTDISPLVVGGPRVNTANGLLTRLYPHSAASPPPKGRSPNAAVATRAL